MSIRNRLRKLELVAGKCEKHFLFVRAREKESTEQAISRTAKEQGLTHDDIGRAFVIGDDICEEIDFGGYPDPTKLQGYEEFSEMLTRVLDAIDGKTLGPPSERTTL